MGAFVESDRSEPLINACPDSGMVKEPSKLTRGCFDVGQCDQWRFEVILRRVFVKMGGFQVY